MSLRPVVVILVAVLVLAGTLLLATAMAYLLALAGVTM
jgi:hypothetical protein